MKIALVSDTHGVCRKELFDHIKNCDYLIHTGDFDNERTDNRFLTAAFRCMQSVGTVTTESGRPTCMSLSPCRLMENYFILSITKLTCLLISRMRIL